MHRDQHSAATIRTGPSAPRARPGGPARRAVGHQALTLEAGSQRPARRSARVLLLEDVHPGAAAVLADAGFEVDRRAGAMEEDQLVAAVRAVRSGASLLDPRLTIRLAERFAPPDVVPAARLSELGGLTAREVDVLRAVSHGATNEEIGRQLGIGEATVKTHVSRVLAKLGLVSRVQAVVFAYDVGLVRPRQR